MISTLLTSSPKYSLIFPDELGHDNNVGTIQVSPYGAIYPWNRNWRGKADDHSSADHDDAHGMSADDDSTLPPESDTPPPGWMSDSSDSAQPPHMDHDHSGLQLYDHKNQPFWIYDVPGHDDHEHHHEIETTTTPAPETPAVVKEVYGHYPLTLKLWYVNIIFGLWFLVYCMWLILKSVGRYKVRPVLLSINQISLNLKRKF